MNGAHKAAARDGLEILVFQLSVGTELQESYAEDKGDD